MDDTQCAECNNDFTKVLNNDGEDGKDGKDSPRRCGSSNTNAVYVEEKGEGVYYARREGRGGVVCLKRKERECSMLVQDQYHHSHLP